MATNGQIFTTLVSARDTGRAKSLNSFKDVQRILEDECGLETNNAIMWYKRFIPKWRATDNSRPKFEIKYANWLREAAMDEEEADKENQKPGL